MKRKIITTALCMALFATNSAYAAYISDKMPDENKIIVSGRVDGAKVNRLINVAVAKKGYDIAVYPQGLLYSAVIDTDENGAFEHEATLNLDNIADTETDFVLYLSYYDAEKLYSEEFTYYNSAVISEIINDIASKTTADEVKSVIESKLEQLNIISSYYTELSTDDKAEIYEEIANKTEFTSVSDFENAFYSCVLAQTLNNVSGADNAGKALADLGKYISLNEIPVYSEFEKLGKKQNEVYSRMTDKALKSGADVANLFVEHVICVAMGNTQNQSEVKTLILKGGELTDEVCRKIEGYTYPGAVYTEFAGKELASFADLNTKVSTIISGNGNGYGAGTSGGSSGGSGGGSGNSLPVNGVGKSANLVSDNGAVQNVSFSDISEAEWAKEKIIYLYGKKIISGYPDGTFKPNKSITREEFVSLIVSAYNLPEANGGRFADVVSGAWYENAVNTAAETGIVSGVSEDTFGIGKNITRQEAAAILLRAAEKFGGFAKQSSEINFTDYEEISDYAKEAVSALNAAGVISGYPDGSFRPNDIMTRAQCSVMLGSVIEKGESNA